MPKYIYKHRRGTMAQWNDYATTIPYEGEIVIEFDDVNNLHKLKIGDGKHTYEELAYLQAGDEIVTQVLAQTTPRVVTVHLTLDWTKVTDRRYSQTVELDNITLHSRLDLQPTADMLDEWTQLGFVLVAENNGGTITVSAVGNMPTKEYTMQATIVETECDGEDDLVVGIPVGTPVAQSDWAQSDDTKADYIKNKPFVTPQMYDAKGDGVTDDTAAIQAALDASPYVYIPDGTYMVNAVGETGKDGGIKPRDNQTIILSKNAVIKAIINGSDRYHIINIIGVDNVTIRGGKVEGDRPNHTMPERKDGETEAEYRIRLGEYGHGIAILRSNNITIEDMEIYECWGDAVCLGSDLDTKEERNCENIHIYNCVLHDNRRQGISITAADGVTVRDCEIYNIGDIKNEGPRWGTNPQAGIDIEPNRDHEQCLNIIIDSCYIHDTTRESIVTFHGDASNFDSKYIIDGVRIVNCRLGGVLNCRSGENIFVSHSTIYQVKLVNSYAINISNCRIDNLLVVGGNGNFDNCEFLTDESKTRLITSNIELYPNQTTESLIFNKCYFKTGKNTKGEPDYFMVLFGPTWTNNIPAEKLIKFTSCKIEMQDEKTYFCNRMPGELIFEDCEVVFKITPYSLFDFPQPVPSTLRLFNSTFTWPLLENKDYGVTDIFGFKTDSVSTVEAYNCEFSNAQRCFYFSAANTPKGTVRMFNNVLNTERIFGDHEFTITAVNDLSKILTSVPSEYVTETELTSKGYLTVDTLPKYTGGVS